MQGLDIAILGAGIGGLSAASLLARSGHKITVFDQFDKPTPIGSGLLLQPAGMKVLKRLGLKDEIIARTSEVTRLYGLSEPKKYRALNVEYRKLNGEAVLKSARGIHRSLLFDMLLKAAQASGVSFNFGQKAVGYNAGIIYFSNGETLESEDGYDLIINAAGVNSPLSEKHRPPLKFGALWTTLNWPKKTNLSETALTQRYFKAQQMVGIIPLGLSANPEQKSAAFFWSLPYKDYASWCQGDLQSWKDEVIKLWPEMDVFVEQIKAHDDMVLATYTHRTVPKPFKGNIVHLGDAWHATSPQLGQGANMALLDSAALFDGIDKADTLQNAFKYYQRQRSGHIRFYQALSWAFTPLYQSDNAFLAFVRDLAMHGFAHWPIISHLMARIVAGEIGLKKS